MIKVPYRSLCATLSLSLLSTGVFAQGAIEEIVVTATKREQTLQDIPVAVTVTTAETIEKAGIADLKDLQSVVPSLRVTQLQNASNTNFIIRGFGNGANNPGVEPSVGVFIDGVYRSRSAAQISDLPNLQRVEVLKGPQNTLFGKNASAGVISVVTREPDGESHGEFSLTTGNHSLVGVKGQVEGAINDNWAFDLSGTYTDRDGYFTNTFTGNDINEKNRYGLRGQLVYRPTDDLKVRFIADYNELDEDCCGVVSLVTGPATNAIFAIGGRINSEDPGATSNYATIDNTEEIENGGLSMQIDKDFGNMTLTSITAYRELEQSSDIDPDFSSAAILTNPINTEIDTFTQEVRLSSNGEGDVDWMIGGFYFDESIDFNNLLSFGPDGRRFFDALVAGLGAPGALDGIESALGLPVGQVFFNGAIEDVATLENETFSIFGTVDWHINDRLTATFGANYTEDEKEATLAQPQSSTFSAVDLVQLGFAQIFNTITGLPPTPANIAANPAAAGAAQTAANDPATNPILGLRAIQFTPVQVDYPNVVEDGRSDDDDVTWTVRLAYDLTDSVNVYGNVSTGFKASSWNLSRNSAPFAEDIPALQAAGLTVPNQNVGTRFAAPEEALLYELGLKAKFDNWSVNIAIFDQEIENFQSNVFNGGGFNLANAGSQSTIGAEIELTYYPTENLKLGFAGTFLDPEYDSFVGAAVPRTNENLSGIGDLTGETPAGIHEVSLSLSANYTFTVAGQPAYFGGSYQYDNEIQVVDNIIEEIASREVKNLNLQAGINWESGWSAQLWARNVTDHDTLFSAFPATAQLGSFNGYRNEPRTYGITIGYEY